MLKPVTYIDAVIDYKNSKGKVIKKTIYGLWDDEKAVFNDKDKTVVRKMEWLTFYNRFSIFYIINYRKWINNLQI